MAGGSKRRWVASSLFSVAGGRRGVWRPTRETTVVNTRFTSTQIRIQPVQSRGEEKETCDFNVHRGSPLRLGAENRVLDNERAFV